MERESVLQHANKKRIDKHCEEKERRKEEYKKGMRKLRKEKGILQKERQGKVYGVRKWSR